MTKTKFITTAVTPGPAEIMSGSVETELQGRLKSSYDAGPGCTPLIRRPPLIYRPTESLSKNRMRAQPEIGSQVSSATTPPRSMLFFPPAIVAIEFHTTPEPLARPWNSFTLGAWFNELSTHGNFIREAHDPRDLE